MRKTKPKMSKFTQKHAQISFCSKLKKQNVQKIWKKKQSAIQKSAKNKPKKQANFNQNKPKNKQTASLKKCKSIKKQAQIRGKTARSTTLYQSNNCLTATHALQYCYLFIYFTIILLQTVAWLVQFRRVTSSFQNTVRVNSKNINNAQNEYTALLESITTFQKFVNSVKNSYWKGSRRIRHTM